MSSTDQPVEEVSKAVPATTTTTTPKLNSVNYSHLGGFITNFLFTYGVGTLNVLPGTSDVGDISDKYQAIVSPAGSAFSIWGLIFMSQAAFTIAQMLPKFRSKPVVQEMKYYWLFVCLAQSAWSIFFGYEMIAVAMVAIFMIFFGLLAVVLKQYFANLERTLVEFWLFRFPFMIHCGWLTAASILNVNLVFIKNNSSAEVQLTVGIISLAILHAISVVWLVLPKYPVYTIPCVLIWANSWIGVELGNPKDQIQDRFGDLVVTGIKNAAYSVAVIISIQVVSRALLAIYMKFFKKSNDIEESAPTSEEDSAV